MSLKKNVIANYLGQGWTALMGLAFLPLYVEYLGMESYGLIGVFAMLQAWLTLLDMGMTPTLNREMARYTAGNHNIQYIRDLLRSLEIIAIGVALLLAFVIAAISSYMALHWLNVRKLPVDVVSDALTVIGVVIGLRFIEGIYRGALLGLQQQVRYNVLNAIFATLRYGGVILVLAWVSPTIQAFFIWQASISILAVIILAHTVNQTLPESLLPAQFRWQKIIDVWQFAGGMMLVTILAILLTQFDKILLSRLLSLADFGYYTLAATVAGVLYIAVVPVTTALYPRLVELSAHDDVSKLSLLYHQGAQLVTLLTVPALMILVFFPHEVLYLWSGNAGLVAEAAPILSVFVLGVFLNSMMYMPTQLQMASGWLGLTIKSNLVAVVILMPCIYWAVQQYGAIGAAWVWVVLNAGYVLIVAQLMHRRLLQGEYRNWYLLDVLLPLVGGVIAVAIVWPFRPEDIQNRGADLGFLLFTALLIFVSVVLFSDKYVQRVWIYMRLVLSR